MYNKYVKYGHLVEKIIECMGSTKMRHPQKLGLTETGHMGRRGN